MLHERFQWVDKALLARRGRRPVTFRPPASSRRWGRRCWCAWTRGRERALRDGLDLGCGTGFFLPALTPRCDADRAGSRPRHAVPRPPFAAVAPAWCAAMRRRSLRRPGLDRVFKPGAAVVRASGPGLCRAAPGAQTRWSGLLLDPAFRGPCATAGGLARRRWPRRQSLPDAPQPGGT